MTQSTSGSAVVKLSQSYDNAGQDLDNLQKILNEVMKVNYEQLEQTLDRKQLLQLHTHLMYVLQSLTYLYSGLTGKQMPPEFIKVEEMYKRIDRLVKGKPEPQPTTKINKKAVDRILKQQL